ncbi:MAG: SAM-dependent methyltransferase [Planctomycetia bacterium]
MPDAPSHRGEFLLVACQGGAEPAVCSRQEAVLPQLTKAAWRRGLVTFRLGGFDPPDDFFPDLVFGRACIRSLGQATGATDAERASHAARLAGPVAWDAIHAWSRDPRAETDLGAVRAALAHACGLATASDSVTQGGSLVLDCVVDSPDRWWIGWHRAATPPSCWPGGIYPGALPAEKVSRAWLKLDEAIATFRIPLTPGQRAVELGASPGGACQRLLEAGLDVVGIDPAIIDERVAGHERFEHWRMRARDVRLKAFRGFHWVVADMNIDPSSTMEAIERAVTAPGASPKGIIATLKLPTWDRAADVPGWLERFSAWGFTPHARQLSTGGREICVWASRRSTRRRDR